MLELQIAQTRRHREKSSRPTKNEKKSRNVYSNHYAKFEQKETKTVGVTGYTNKTNGGKCLQKIRKYLSNVHKMEGAHHQCEQV